MLDPKSQIPVINLRFKVIFYFVMIEAQRKKYFRIVSEDLLSRRSLIKVSEDAESVRSEGGMIT